MQIRDKVEIHRLFKLNDAYQMALKVEARLARGSVKKYVEVRSLYPSPNGESSRGKATISKPDAAEKSKFSFGNANANQSGRNKPNSCFKCGEIGHHFNSCPKRQINSRVNFVDEEGFDDSNHPIYDDDGETDEHLELPPEEGESLVIYRVLTTPKADSEENWLHSSIFKTRCKTQGGKMCTIVIDGGSYENIVSQDGGQTQTSNRATFKAVPDFLV